MQMYVALRQNGELICTEGTCGAEMDALGDHAVTCKCGPSRSARHDAVNNTWAFALKGAGLSVKTEVFTDPDTMRRSADTLVDRWEYGRSVAHDWVVSHTLQKTALAPDGGRGRNANFALEQAARKKESYAKEVCERRGLDFIPLTMDTFGGVGEGTKKAISVAVAHARLHRGNTLYDRRRGRGEREKEKEDKKVKWVRSLSHPPPSQHPNTTSPTPRHRTHPSPHRHTTSSTAVSPRLSSQPLATFGATHVE